MKGRIFWIEILLYFKLARAKFSASTLPKKKKKGWLESFEDYYPHWDTLYNCGDSHRKLYNKYNSYCLSIIRPMWVIKEYWPTGLFQKELDQFTFGHEEQSGPHFFWSFPEIMIRKMIPEIFLNTENKTLAYVPLQEINVTLSQNNN